MVETEGTDDKDAELLRLAASDPKLRQDERIARLVHALRKRVAELLGLSAGPAR